MKGMQPALGRIYGARRLTEPRFQAVVIATLALVATAYRALQFLRFTSQIQWGYDFSAYWQAAGRLLHGAPIYTSAQLVGPYSPQQQYLYLYPPFLAVLSTPLAAAFPADYRAAMWLWAAVGAVIVASVSLGIARLERLPPDGRRFIWVVAAFVFPPVVGELVMGNVHLILLGLLALAWWAIRLSDDGDARGDAVAGVAIGAAALVKVFPALLILWLVLTGRSRAAGFAILGFVLLAAATIPISGIQPWLDYPAVIANIGPPVDTYSTLAPAVWLGGIAGPTFARVLVVVAVVVSVTWTARRLDDGAGFALAVTGSIAIAPALYHHYLAILVLPLLLAIAHTRRPVLLLVPYLAMFAGDQPALGEVAWIVNRVPPTFGLLALFVLLLVEGTARLRPLAARQTAS
jgi:alpha-1,2-mannosyltransferase